MPALPLDFAGPAQAKIVFDGVPETGGRTTFTLTGEGLSLAFSGEAALAQAGLSANGTASLEAADLDPWLATAGVSLPGMGLGLPASLSAGLDFDGGLLVLSGLEGAVAETPLSGDLNAELREGLPHVTGALALDYLDLAPVAELVTGAGALAAEGERFGLVVCDPPAFAPSKPALEAGLRAYERVARLAAPLVAPGGYLVLCSCSHAADLTAFRNACGRGIGRGGRRAQLIHTGFAGPDHPLLPQLAESGYLKALFFRLDG